MDVSIVVSLLSLFFLLHELEEIIMVRSWLDKNQAALRERFSNLGHIIVWMEQMTTRRFIVVAAEEFIIVSLCTLMCLYFGKIVVWYCCLAPCSICYFPVDLFNPLPETGVRNIMKETFKKGGWQIPVNQVA